MQSNRLYTYSATCNLCEAVNQFETKRGKYVTFIKCTGCNEILRIKLNGDQANHISDPS